MKRVLTSSMAIIVIIIFAGLCINSQTIGFTDLNISKQLIINGSVSYSLDLTNRITPLTVILKARFPKGSSYKIIGIKLNGQNIPYREGIRYFKWIQNYRIKVGQKLEIQVGVKKITNSIVFTKPKYFTVANFEIKNYITKYNFPTNDQVINLNSTSSPYLNFSWESAGFTNKTLLRITNLSTNNRVLYKELSENNCHVDKNIFSPNIKYHVHHDSKDHSNFKLSRETSTDSQISFNYSCSFNFITE